MWKGNTETDPFKRVACLKGHTGPVVCLRVGGRRLFSGSMDSTIRVWDLDTLQCVTTLKEHKEAVTSLLCWDQYLLSCSLDGTLKVWGNTESGGFEVVHTHNEGKGILALCGIYDLESKPMLFCSSNDNIVHVYDMPSFTVRGKIFSKHEVRVIEVGRDGLFFMGDGSGKLTVWNLSGNTVEFLNEASEKYISHR